MLKESLKEPSVLQKDLFIVSALLFNAFSWHYVAYIVIENLLILINLTYTQNLVVWLTHYIVVIGSGLVGSIISTRISRVKFLYLWTLLGIVSSALPALLSTFTMAYILMISVLLGVSFGLGMPSCFAYFASYTSVENRGKISGITWLVTNLSAPLFAVSSSTFDLKTNSLILATWRAFGLVLFFLKPKEINVSETKRKTSFVSILQDKSFVLYLAAWLMFNLVESFERPILDYIFGDFHYVLVAPVIGSFFTLIAGVLCDRIGRKRVVLYGFVTMGIAYGIIGIAPTALFPWYFFLTTESISWGIFYVTFILVLWGDLSESGNREKYYVIGAATPYFLSDIVRMLSAPHVVLIPPTSAFSVASFFLFIAILPLLYAPETLPERKIELRKLKKYVKAAKEIQRKSAEKVVIE